MKVCVIELINNGGMVHYASQLCNHLSSFNDSTKVYLISPNGINENIFDSRVILKKIPSFGRHGYRIDLIMKYISEIQPDVIHLTVIHPFIIPILPSLKRIAPVVVTIHDVILHSDQNNIVINKTTNILSKSADLNFVHGEKLKLQLIENGVSESKVSSIPHGDFSFFKALHNSQICEEEHTVLFFGRILKYKGIEYLIKAEPLISSKFPDFKIIIAGDGDFTPYEQMIVNRDHFEIINQYLPDDLISDLFQRASVVVLPYIEASQSGVVPIAYAFKKPVVVTDVGSLSEVVINGVTGFVIPPKNSEYLADSISKIFLDSKLKNSMGKAAYRFMEKNMSWEEIAHKTIREYDKLQIEVPVEHKHANRHAFRDVIERFMNLFT